MKTIYFKPGDTMGCTRKTLPNVSDFKTFWKEQGPFQYALTSCDYPPVLLAPEEWIFGNDKIQVLKELMGFDREKMAVVPAPFNPNKKSILRPETLCAWKISHFPEPWNLVVCDAFVPEGHLTCAVTGEVAAMGETEEKNHVETAFFNVLARDLEQMGYLLFGPRGDSRSAAVGAYLEEWAKDEADAGIL